ncbi:hypothetical protein Taro_031493 [Colocasia esculenta]|uniref:Uncharacterized protein n=1 Tax=Colocasia esculenta TaxID=4460 RepID=A0A843VS34_COLES|nr:hypothetical protein [Colocasia esculenta]
MFKEILVAGELWIDHKKLIFFPLFVYFSLCKPSSWSRQKIGCSKRSLPSGLNIGFLENVTSSTQKVDEIQGPGIALPRGDAIP